MKNSNLPLLYLVILLIHFMIFLKTSDSIEFLGLKILENSKLKNTKLENHVIILMNFVIYNLALNESDENIKNEYFSQAINALIILIHG